jgi:hypothetical protein
MSSHTTVVTMFFNLKKLPDATQSTRPLDFYVKNGKPTLDLPYPMVIFCDAETRPFLEAGRKHPTVYIEKEITEYEFYRMLWPIIVENRKTRPSPDPRNTASFLLTMMFKFQGMYLAKDTFPGTHLAWVDFGSSHIARSFSTAVPEMLERPNPKLSCCYIHYRSHDEMYPMDARNGLAGCCGIAATVFTIEKSYVNRVYTAAFSILLELISHGLGHAEEQVFTYLYNKHPELFTLYFGDYYSSITNYHSNVEDHYAVRTHFIENARRAGRLDLVALAESRFNTPT